MKNPIVFFIAFSLLVLPPLFAEEAPLPAGYITYAQGEGFEIIRGGQKRFYDPSIDVVDGTEIRVGDFINTYDNTFLELLLEPGDRVVKVSEQTSFSVPEGISIDLSYGRVRARVKKLAHGRSFTIRGMSTAAGVRGTDFGFDIIALSEMGESTVEDPLFESSVYCFEGSLEVRDIITDDQVSDKPTIVSSGEMVVRYSDDEGSTFSTEPINEEIQQFWQIHKFVTQLPEKNELPPPQPKADPARLTEKAKEYRKAATVTGITGALLTATGAIIAFADPLTAGINGRENIATGLAVSGGIFLATSLLSYILSFK